MRLCQLVYERIAALARNLKLGSVKKFGSIPEASRRPELIIRPTSSKLFLISSLLLSQRATFRHALRAAAQSCQSCLVYDTVPVSPRHTGRGLHWHLVTPYGPCLACSTVHMRRLTHSRYGQRLRQISLFFKSFFPATTRRKQSAC